MLLFAPYAMLHAFINPLPFACSLVGYENCQRLTPSAPQRELPHLNLSQVFDALAYYLDHRETIDREIEQDREEVVSREFPAGKY